MECLNQEDLDLPFPINQDQECLDLKDTQSLLHFLGLCQCFLVQVLLASQRLLVFFSVPQTSFFKSSPPSAPAQPQQQKSSFFNLPTSLQTDSLTGDLFGLFKGTESAISDETKLPDKGHDGTQDSKEQKSSAVSEPESTVASAELVNEEQLKQSGSESLKLVEEKEFKSPDETKYESKEITETSETIPIQTSESGLPSKVPPGDKENPTFNTQSSS